MMDGHATWKRLIARRPGHAATGPQPGDTAAPPSPGELRQRHLERLRTRGIPLWSEAPEHCDGCGRVLLAGEQPLLLRRGDELLLACPLCAGRLCDAGCQRVSIEAGKNGEQEAPLPLAI